MKKRIISLLLVLSMLLCVLPAASAEETVPNFTRYSISLNKSIAINFKVKLADIVGKNPSVTFEKGGETYGPYIKYGVDGDYAVFTFRDLSPDEMAIPVTATLNTSAGSTFISKSVKDYCESMLDNESSSGNLKKLIVDLLNYGAAFQTYKGQETGLVNEDLTSAHKALATEERPLKDIKATEEIDNPTATIGDGLMLVDSVQIYYLIKADSAEGLKLKVTVGKDTYEYSTFENVTYEGEDYLRVNFGMLNPTQMGEKVVAQVYQGDTPISDAKIHSIESYAAQAVEANTDANLVALVKEMIKYGDSAASYVEEPDGEPVVKTEWFNYHFSQFDENLSVTDQDWKDHSEAKDDGNYTIGVNNNKELQLTLGAQRTKPVYARGCYSNPGEWADQNFVVECSLINWVTTVNTNFEYGVQLVDANKITFIVCVYRDTLWVNDTKTGVSVSPGTHTIKIARNSNNTFDVYLDGNPVKEGVGYYNGGSGVTNVQLYAKENNTSITRSACFDDVKVYTIE